MVYNLYTHCALTARARARVDQTQLNLVLTNKAPGCQTPLPGVPTTVACSNQLRISITGKTRAGGTPIQTGHIRNGLSHRATIALTIVCGVETFCCRGGGREQLVRQLLWTQEVTKSVLWVVSPAADGEVIPLWLALHWLVVREALKIAIEFTTLATTSSASPGVHSCNH